MKVFVAGATGAIGRRIVPLLAEAGHEVTALVRSEEKAREVAALGAGAEVADALDRDALSAAARRAAPEVSIHEPAGVAPLAEVRKFDRDRRRAPRRRRSGGCARSGRAHRGGPAGRARGDHP